MVNNIVIPVRDQLHFTQDICEQLQFQQGWDVCWVIDNGSTDDTYDYLWNLSGADGRFVPISAAGQGIYEMWDRGFRLAVEEGADIVTFLNNDLILGPGCIQEMANVFSLGANIGIVYPNYDLAVGDGLGSIGGPDVRFTSGTYRHGGMSGFCFALRASAVTWSPLVDPQFEWYGGDDDIAFNVEAAGYVQARIEWMPVDHIMEGTARHYDLGFTKGEDMARILTKWGR